MNTLTEISDLYKLNRESVKRHLKRNRLFIKHTYGKRKTIGGTQRVVLIDAKSFLNSFKKQKRYEFSFESLLLQLCKIRNKHLEKQVTVDNYLFDFKIGNLYIEYDEEQHKTSIIKSKDIIKSKVVTKLVRVNKGYEVDGLLKINTML